VATIIVERSFPAPVTDAELMGAAQRQADCLDVHRVVYKRSILSDDRLRMICEYEAADTESVRKVRHEARFPADRIWAGKTLG
jgi:hypothetical protein